MTRMRFDRPQLVYVDNLRRELSKASLPNVASASIQKPKSRLERHIAEIEQMAEQQQFALGHLIECYALYVDGFSYELARLAKNHKGRAKPKKTLTLLREELVDAGVEILRQAILDSLAKRASAVDWLMKFLKLMPKADREAWRLLDECLVEECVPLVEDTLEKQGLIGVLSAKQ